MSDKNEKFKKISDEESSQISGGSGAGMIYKKRFLFGLIKRYYVLDSNGHLMDKFFSFDSAFKCAAKSSEGNPGDYKGSVRMVETEEVKKRISQGRMDNILL